MKKSLSFIMIFNCLTGFIVRSQDIKSLDIVPKKDFEYNSLLKYQKDTLEIVSCAKYVLFPFGEIDNISQLKTSLLKDFKATGKKTNDSISYYYCLETGPNKLTLLFDTDLDASSHSNITAGLIHSKGIKTINNIQVGMSTESFFRLIFTSFPNEIIKKYSIVILDYCVNGIRHFYSFRDNKLEQIEYK